MKIIYALILACLPLLSYSQNSSKASLTADVFSNTVEVIGNPMLILSGESVHYWQLVGGGDTKAKVFNEINRDLITGIYFGKDSLFIQGCNNITGGGNPRMLTSLFGCSNSIGQFEVEQKRKAIIYYDVYGTSKSEKIIKLNSKRLVTEDEKGLRYLYIPRPESANAPQEISIKQYSSLTEVNTSFKNPKLKFQYKQKGINVDELDSSNLNQLDDSAEDDKPYTFVDEAPEFPGGEAEMLKYIATNFKYPIQVYRQEIEGLVVLSFIVNRDGGLEAIEIAKGLHTEVDKEAIRMVSSMPKWTPGIKNQKKVSTQYTLPIRVKIPNKE